MAEHSFQEVMRQFDRMCKANAGCINCPLYEQDGVSDGCSIGAFVHDYERIEREIMAWAEEHPEPVYPTWYEFLTSRYHKAWEAIGCDSIPADIAQKLGIEPKEG